MDFFWDVCFLRFSAIISSNAFSVSFSLSFLSGTPMMWMLICLMSHKPLKLFSLFFLTDALIGWFTLLSSSSLILYFTWFNLVMRPLLNFFTSVIIFFSPMISIWYFKNIFISVEILTLFMHCSPNPSENLYNCYFEIFVRSEIFVTYLHFIKESFWIYVLFFCLLNIPMFLHFLDFSLVFVH